MSQGAPVQSQNRPTLSLQTRLVSFVLLVALLPLLIISTRDTLQTQQALTSAAESSLKSSAVQTANSLDTFIQSTLDAIAFEAQFADFKTYLESPPAERAQASIKARARDLLDKLSKKGSLDIISYALVDPQGKVLLDSANLNAQNDESHEAYFPLVQFGGRPVVTAVTYSADKTTSITFASKVVRENGDYIGILRAKYNAAVLQDVIANSVGPGTDASIVLLDQLNIRMADSQHPELILKSVVPLVQVDYLIAVETHRFLDLPREQQATNFLDFQLGIDNAENQPFFRADITPSVPGDDSIAVAFLKTQPWTVTYSRPTSIFLADVQRQIRINIILVLATLIIMSLITTVIARSLTNPISALARVTDSISHGDLDARAEVNTTDEIGVLASAFNSMADQLQSTLVGLERSVHDRTADLEESNLDLETIAGVAREIATIRDVDTLLKVSVELIREQLQHYHVGLYFVDERGEFAILRAASGANAEPMLEQNYKVRVDDPGLIGDVIRTRKASLALDVGSEAVRFENPFLPAVRSEITLPLTSHNVAIAALDIQSDVAEAFDQRAAQTLQILADQLAAAIENAQLVQQVQGTLTELNKANRSQTQKSWQAALDERTVSSYEYDGRQVRPIPQDLPAELRRRLEMGKSIVIQEYLDSAGNQGGVQNTLLVPLMVLNQLIGVIGLEQQDRAHIWTDDEMAIAEAAANRAALTLENARLLEESQRRALKESTISEATARIGAALNVENILDIAAQELERVTGNSEIILQINTGGRAAADKVR